MAFTCPVCRLVCVEGNSIQGKVENYQLARVCWPCAKAIQRAVRDAEEEFKTSAS